MSAPSTEWKAGAVCARRPMDADLFYAGERHPDQVRQARGICTPCPVRTACLISAYLEGDEWGIRAGLTPRQRKAQLRKAGGSVARAVTNALESTAVILQRIYEHHARPMAGGHVLWEDRRHFINVRGTPYTVHRLAWVAHYGVESVGHVRRTCDVVGCVAKGCLSDQRSRAGAVTA